LRLAAPALALIAALSFAACGGGDDDEPARPGENTPLGGTFTPVPTIEVPPTFDPSTSTPSPADFVGVVTMDTDPATPAIEHNDITAAVGATFEIGIVINMPPGEYRGYQVALGWDDNGILSYVGEVAPMPANMTICEPVGLLLAGTLTEGRTGVYGGCLSPEIIHQYAGPVSVLTFMCDQPGTIGLRPLSVNESMSLGTSLITEIGATLGEGVDNGISVICT
jgi:hypothetical protein